MIWTQTFDAVYWANFKVNAEQWSFVKISQKFNAPFILNNPLITLHGQFFYIFEVADANKLEEFGLSPVYQVLENGTMIDMQQPLYFGDLYQADPISNTFNVIQFVPFNKRQRWSK